jgi:uncharacterized membrane protein
MEYLIVKWVHVVSSTLLFGTGVGSAFYLFFISRTRDARVVMVVARHVVLADWLFTAPTVVIQPLSGWYLVSRSGLSWSTLWLADAVRWYAFAVACWLPVIWLQMRLRNMAAQAAQANQALPALYWRYLRVWVVLGTWALIAFLILFYLMVAKPGR